MYVTIAEAATVLERTPRAVRYMIQQGRLSAVRRGNAWFIRSEHLPLTEAQRKKLLELRGDLREIVDRVLFAPDDARPTESAPTPPSAALPYAAASGLQEPSPFVTSAPAMAPVPVPAPPTIPTPPPAAPPAAPAVAPPVPLRAQGKAGRHHSALHLEILRTALHLHATLEDLQTREQPLKPMRYERIDAALTRGVESLCRFVHLFDLHRKRNLLGEAREAFCQVLGYLLLELARLRSLPSAPNTDAAGTSAVATAPATPLVMLLACLESDLLPSVAALARKMDAAR